MHEEGFKRALTNVLNAYGVKKGYIKGDDKVTGDDVREGLTAIVSVKLTEAQFEGQTKAKLGNASMRTLVSNIVTQQLTEFLEENPAVGKLILDKAMMANRAREAARKAREAIRRKTGLESGQMPDKLRDCNDTDPTLTELYIVEGDSAGGSATQGRDSRFQAILPPLGQDAERRKGPCRQGLRQRQAPAGHHRARRRHRRRIQPRQAALSQGHHHG